MPLYQPRVPSLGPVSPRARLILLVLAAGSAAVIGLVLGPHSITELRSTVAAAGVSAPVVLLAAWLVLVPLLVSGSLLAAGTGVVLGPAVGLAVALPGATLGAGIAFLAARTAAGDAARRLAGRRLRLVEERLVRRPVLGVALLRVAPGVPAGPLAYAAGLTRVRLRDFLAGMALGGAPRIFVYAALGGTAADPGSPLGLTALGVFALLTIVGLAAGWRARRRFGSRLTRVAARASARPVASAR